MSSLIQKIRNASRRIPPARPARSARLPIHYYGLKSSTQFFSATANALRDNKGSENFQKLADHIEKENSRKSIKRQLKLTYWHVGIVAFVTAICVYSQFAVDRKIFWTRHPRFTIIKRENVSSTAFVLTVRPMSGPAKKGRKSEDPYAEYRGSGSWSVEIVQPELQIVRRYTPLPPLGSDRSEELRFLIRKISGGEISTYLDRLAVGSEVRIGQPSTYTFDKNEEQAPNILFLAGGTGIASAMGVAYSLLEKKQNEAGTAPKMHIIWANRRREDCLGGATSSAGSVSEGHRINKMVQELNDLQRKCPGQLSVEYVVDEENTFIDERTILARKAASGPHGTAIMISGPDGFVSYLAGPKVWENGKEQQGPLGGLLGRLQTPQESSQVLKL